MANFFLDATKDDTINGTSGADIVYGPAGGTDHVSTLGGSDRITVTHQVFMEYYYFDDNQFWEFYGTGAQYKGSIDGGAGSDTLVVTFDNVFGVPVNFEQVARENGVIFSLHDTIITGVERLEVWNDTAISVDQLNAFDSISGNTYGEMRLTLFGAGGTFDLQSRAQGLTAVHLDASKATSGVTYTGIAGKDTVQMGASNDTYVYTGGADFVRGGLGRDTLDLVWTDDSPLVLSGSRTINTTSNGLDIGGFEVFDVTAGGGNDEISGWVYGDTLKGMGGDDVLDGHKGDDILYGGDGNDILYGRPVPMPLPNDFYGFDELYGEAGDDLIYAEGDKAYGGDGNDTIVATQGGNFVDGGTGRDNIVSYGGDEVHGGDGNDRISYAGKGSVIHGDDGNDYITFFESTVARGTGPNHIHGDGGNDTIVGGGKGDFLYGGTGDDTYVLTTAGAVIEELAGQGTDTIQSRVSITLPTAVERLELLGKANANGVGTDSANYLTGNDGNNILTGKGGLDALEGGGGADTFRYLALSDSNAVTGMDRIVDFDFAEGDRVNVSAIDANAGLAGNQAFDTLIAADAAFTEAGQFRFSKMGNYFLAEFNVNGDATAELAIRFQGIEPPDETWFIL